jgi:hypothetical protein
LGGCVLVGRHVGPTTTATPPAAAAAAAAWCAWLCRPPRSLSLTHRGAHQSPAAPRAECLCACGVVKGVDHRRESGETVDARP